MRTGIIVILTIVSMWACKLKENPAPKLSGGNNMKVMAEILSLNQDSTAQVLINNVFQRNSSPLTHSLQNGDIVDFYFSFGYSGYSATDSDGNKYTYSKLNVKDIFNATLIVKPNLNSSEPSYKVVWYKKQ